MTSPSNERFCDRPVLFPADFVGPDAREAASEYSQWFIAAAPQLAARCTEALGVTLSAKSIEAFDLAFCNAIRRAEYSKAGALTEKGALLCRDVMAAVGESLIREDGRRWRWQFCDRSDDIGKWQTVLVDDLGGGLYPELTAFNFAQRCIDGRAFSFGALFERMVWQGVPLTDTSTDALAAGWDDELPDENEAAPPDPWMVAFVQDFQSVGVLPRGDAHVIAARLLRSFTEEWQANPSPGGEDEQMLLALAPQYAFYDTLKCDAAEGEDVFCTIATEIARISNGAIVLENLSEVWSGDEDLVLHGTCNGSSFVVPARAKRGRIDPRFFEDLGSVFASLGEKRTPSYVISGDAALVIMLNAQERAVIRARPGWEGLMPPS